PRVWAEPLQLLGAFGILVSNAVRCLDKELAGWRFPAGWRVLCLRRGGQRARHPGHSLAPLFEPFVRGPAPDGRAKGTDLGLFFAGSHHFAELTPWRIRIRLLSPC